MRRDAESIFESIAQDRRDIDPSSIRLIEDRVLIKDLGDLEQAGSIIIPQTARADSRAGSPRLRLGLVIAVGPGDKFVERGMNERTDQVLRVAITEPCKACDPGDGKGPVGRRWNIDDYEFVICPRCNGTKRQNVVVPPQCQPGDKVLYDRRKESEFYFGDDKARYVLCHAEQAVIAVVED
jgi:co-chaperonin GroES (HSP10)